MLSKKPRGKTRGSAAKLVDAKKELQDAYDVEQAKRVREKVHIITNSIEHRKSGLAWQTVKEMTGRKGANRGRIKAKHPAERRKKWQDYFTNLLGQPPVVASKPTITIVEETLPINTENISMEELVKCVNGFKNGRVAGLDNIPIEGWKSGALNTELLEVRNKAFNGDRPDIWFRSGIVPIPKKGDIGITNNYRGISLTVTAGKIFNKLLIDRIRPHLDPLL